MAISSINEVRQSINNACRPAAEDRARAEAIEGRRRQLSEPRGSLDKVMIVERSGRGHDIKTGRPPAMKSEAKEAWERAREEASIDKLFR